MRRLVLFVLVMMLIGAASGLEGCSMNPSDQSRMDRAMKDMDQGRYADAKGILQDQLNRHPGDSRTMVLLAEADLGLAGIQLMDFVDAVSRPQEQGPELDLAATPDCGSGAITKIQGTDIRCVLLRVVEHLPDPDNPDFAEARTLLRQAYPDPRGAPLNVNFLTSVVELGSAMGRARLMLEKTAWMDADAGRELDGSGFHFVVHNLKNEFIELMNGIRRARYSYEKISKYVVDLDGKQVIRAGDQELTFSEDLDIPTLLEFAESVVDEYKDKVNGQLNQALSEGFDRLPYATVFVMERLDRIYSLGFFTDNVLVPTLSFAHGIDKFLSFLSDGDTSRHQDFDLLTLLWRHPPAVLKALPAAFSQAWDTEQIDPLNAYYRNTQAQWFALKQLVSDWNGWVSANLNRQEADEIGEYLREQKNSDPRLTLPPQELTENALKNWQATITTAVREHLIFVLQGGSPDLPAFTPEQQASGLALLNRTMGWIQANLWTVN